MLAHSGYHFFYNTETGSYLIKTNEGMYRDMNSDDARSLNVWARENNVDQTVLDRAIAELASVNRISLIRDSLLSLKWDGKKTIAEVSEALLPYYEYLEFSVAPYTLLKSWMLGAVGKVLGDEPGHLLLIEGDSGIGKSKFITWLCSGIESIYLYKDLNFTDKTTIYNAQRYFVWQISNFDSIKPFEADFLCDFIQQKEGSTQEFKDCRKLNASFIAESQIQRHGCMATPFTRFCFLIMPLDRISDYYTEFDPSQAWAEAVARWLSGERWYLTSQDDVINTLFCEARNPYTRKRYAKFKVL